MSENVGSICQSCSMPITEPTQFGTGAGGALSAEYCHLCFQDGRFTAPDMTMAEMVELVAKFWAEFKGLPPEAARTEVRPILAGLKRWQGDE